MTEYSNSDFIKVIEKMADENRKQNEQIIMLLENQNKILVEVGQMIAKVAQLHIINSI